VHYDERKLHSVTVSLIDVPNGDATFASISISLSARDAEDRAGPGLDVKLEVPSSGGDTVAKKRERAVELAYAMIHRIAREDLATLEGLAGALSPWA
jgi:hypothetical protein